MVDYTNILTSRESARIAAQWGLMGVAAAMLVIVLVSLSGAGVTGPARATASAPVLMEPPLAGGHVGERGQVGIDAAD